jgi:hypothetical protein
VIAAVYPVSLRPYPITLREANGFIRAHHRHHVPVRGCRFVIGCVTDGDKLVGVAVVGRPVSRGCAWRRVAEVTRLASDGTANVCSLLYAACARAARALGYAEIQTYILAAELGTSLRAAGWTYAGATAPRTWIRDADDPTARQLDLAGGTRRTDQPNGPKQRWTKAL